jgi:hypothetical protein
MGFEFIKLVKLKGDDKKYKAVLLNKDTGREVNVKFGAAGMQDYTKYFKRDGKKIADEKKAAYKARHRKNEDWNDVSSAAFWAVRILWNKPSVEASLADVKRKFF